MIPFTKGLLILLITISFNTYAQNLKNYTIDSTTVSRSLRLLHDYKACTEINERLTHRLDVYREKVRADSITMNDADSLIQSQDTLITSLTEKNYELSEKNGQLKKRRKFFFLGGLITGLSAFLLVVF